MVNLIGFDTDNNPMKNPIIAEKIAGDNHYMRKNPQARENSRQKQNKLVCEGKHNLQGDRNPNKDGRNAKTAYENGITSGLKTIRAYGVAKQVYTIGKMAIVLMPAAN